MAARHPDTPWYAKALVAGVAAYAFSPIDLIPDFIRVLGLLDDLVLIPLGIALAIRMIPPQIWTERSAQAQLAIAGGRQVSRTAAGVIIGIWALMATLGMRCAYEAFADFNQFLALQTT